MSHSRQEKINRIAYDIPDQTVFGPESGDLLVVSWGGTYGAVYTAVSDAQANGHSVAHAHIRYLNPFPLSLGKILNQYKRIMVAELNMGQLSRLLRDHYAIEPVVFTKIQGQPFKVRELKEKITDLLETLGD